MTRPGPPPKGRPRPTPGGGHRPGSRPGPAVPWASCLRAAREVAASVVELAVHLTAEEDHRSDDGKRDERDQQDVLNQVGAPLIPTELGLQPAPNNEEVHCVAPSFRLDSESQPTTSRKP